MTHLSPTHSASATTGTNDSCTHTCTHTHTRTHAHTHTHTHTHKRTHTHVRTHTHTHTHAHTHTYTHAHIHTHTRTHTHAHTCTHTLSSMCLSLLTISSSTSFSPRMSRERPVSGSTTWRMVLRFHSYSSLLIGIRDLGRCKTNELILTVRTVYKHRQDLQLVSS